MFVSGHGSNMLDWISFKFGMIMDLPSGHMHVDWIFDPIQNGHLVAIFDVKTDPKCPYPAIAQTCLIGSRSNFA